MSADLFDKRTAKEKLLDFIREKRIVFTHQVIEWGLNNKSNRADRNARQLAKEGFIRRMDEARKKFLFPYGVREDVWELIPGEGDYLK